MATRVDKKTVERNLICKKQACLQTTIFQLFRKLSTGQITDGQGKSDTTKEHEKTKPKQADAKPNKTSSNLVCPVCGKNNPPKKCLWTGKTKKFSNLHHSAHMLELKEHPGAEFDGIKV